MPELSEEDLRGLFSQLSERQLEVVRLLAAHQTAKQIARTLRISEHTIRAHSRELRKRLGASNTREAAILLVRYEGSQTLVNNRQPQSGGIAPDLGLDAGSDHDQHPEHHRPQEDAEIATGEQSAFFEVNVVRADPDVAAGAPVVLPSGGRGLTRGLIWLHSRLNAVSPVRWIALIGGATVVVLFITVGAIAGAGALLQTLQELSVRAR